MSGLKIGFGSNVCRAIVRSAAGVIIEERVQRNMVLNQGRANIHAYGVVGAGSITHACAVGSSSQSITAGTTQLNDEEARVVCGSRSMSVAGTRESMIASFSSGQIGGKTLHTWGFSHSESAGANINTAGVFKDGGGSPSPISVPVGASLTLEYEFGALIGLGPTPFSINVAGLGVVSGDYSIDGGGSHWLWALTAIDSIYNNEWPGYARLVGGGGSPVASASLSVSKDGSAGLKLVPAPATVGQSGDYEGLFLESSQGSFVTYYEFDSPLSLSQGDVIQFGEMKISW